jgi:hypothetical protein
MVARSSLRALGGDVGRPPRRRQVDDLGVDLDDAAVAPRPHSGEDGAPEQHRALDEELELCDVVLPHHLAQRRFRLRAGRVEHQHVDGAEAVGHSSDEIRDLPLVGDVGREGVGDPARIPDDRDDLERPRVTADIVDGHGQAVAGEAPRDGAAQPAGAARYEGDALPQRLQPCVRLRPAGGAQSVPGVGVGGCAHVNAVDCASRVLRATPHYTTRSAPTLPAVQAASYVINAAEVEHQPWGFRFPAR